MKPPFRYATVANGVIFLSTLIFKTLSLLKSTDEVVRTYHKKTYSYMKQFMTQTIAEGIKAVKNRYKIHHRIIQKQTFDFLSL